MGGWQSWAVRVALGAIFARAGRADAADCPAGAAALSAELSSADAAFRDMNLEAFRAASARASTLLACLGEPLGPTLAAAVHRNRGLDAFLARDLERGAVAFAAARELDPAFRWSADMLPPGHPALQLYASRPAGGAHQDVAELGLGELRFDGRDTLQRPLEVPTILQRLDDVGAVQETLYLWPGESPSWLQPASSASALLGRERSETRARRGSLITLGVTALAAGASAVALYDVARREADTYWDPTTSADELDLLRARVNTSQGLALGAAALGVGAGVGFTIVYVWD